MGIEQNSEEKNAQLEADAEQITMMKSTMQYAHSLMEQFEQVDDCTISGVFSYQGVHYIATFYRTVEDLIDDSWSLSIDEITFAR